MAAITNDMQAYLTGHLLGLVTTEAAKYRAGEGTMKIVDVKPDRDEHGNYLSSFSVTFESGLLLSVNVNEVTEIDEA